MLLFIEIYVTLLFPNFKLIFYQYCVSPSQNQHKFKSFCTNFDILLNKINDKLLLCSIVTGDFNARCSRWWKNDITNLKVKSLLTSGGYNQIIDKPTHIINNSMSCIDLYFAPTKV